MKRRLFSKLLTVTLVTSASGALLALGQTTPAQAAQSNNDTLVVAQSSDADTLDPQMQGKMPDMNILINMFDTLVTRNANNQLAPDLATSWKALNSTTWQFTLRRGVKFQDGEPFNASVVKYSIDRLLNPATKSPIVELQGHVKEVKVVNPYTVDFITIGPDPILPNKLTLFDGVMVPPKYIQQHGSTYFSNHPIGTGPFEFVSWQKDNQVVMKANPTYWRGVSKIKNLIFKDIPNPADMVAALKTGEIDIATGLTSDMAAQLKGTSNVRVVSSSGIRTYYVDINTTQAGPLANTSVRQAMNYAVDVNGIIGAIFGGDAQRTATLVPRQNFGFDSKVQPYSFNLTKAKQLMAKAGYANGFTTELDAETPDAEAAQAIAGQLAQIGIKVQVNVMDPNTFTEELLANKLAPLYYIGNTGWTMDAESNFQSYLKSDRRYNHWKNPTVDKLVDQEELNIAPEKRLQAFDQLQKILIENAPFIYLYQTDNVYGMTNRVHWTPNPVGVLSMYTASIN